MDRLLTEPRANLELKARCADLDEAERRALALGAVYHADEMQIDTFFACANGRLKLREVDGREALLIAYERPDAMDVTRSRYHLVPVPEPALLRTALTETLGVRLVVRKSRRILMWRNVRIHLDRVEGLGTFLEFEAVLERDEPEGPSHERLARLTRALEIRDEDCLAVAYADLLGAAPG